MTPYKLYINWTGTYTAGTMSGTFTELTDPELFDVNITVSRRRDDKSIAIIRTFADGDFIIGNTSVASNYDLLQTAISNGLPELIIKIERYSVVGAAYVEMWRGTVETRPDAMDDNTQLAKMAKFKTVDRYSDVEVSFSHTWKETFAVYMTAPAGLYFDTGSPSIFDMRRIFDTDESTFTDNFVTVDINNKIVNKYWDLTALKITPGYYDSGFTYAWGAIGDKPLGMYLSSPYVDNNPTKTVDLTMSIKTVVDMYRTLNNLFWYIDEAVYDSVTFDAIQFKAPADLFGLTALDYTTESADFAGYRFIGTDYFIRETFEMNEKNQIVDHSTQSFEYDLLAEEEFVYSNPTLITDTILSTREASFFDTKDMYMWVAERRGTDQVNSETAPSINPDVINSGNYKGSLAYRMENFLNDYRQLDSATFNGSVQALNPNIALPSQEQDAFPIELDLLSDLDFTATITTSIGETFAQEVRLELKTDVIELICRK